MIALSIEQMKHLQELGLDTSDASMYYSAYGEEAEDYDYFELNIGVDTNPDDEQVVIPAYTLQDILGKLPKDIPHGEDVCPLYIVPNYYNPKEWEIIYSMPVYLSGIKHSETNENLLQGCYDMLCWCIENKYIKV